jgi:redox-sensitive bicupin YhaK (pirin superfamily)
MQADSWNRTLATNLPGAANATFCVARHMVGTGRAGRIVNVSSRGAFRGEPAHLAYGASKAAMNSMGQSLAQQLAPHGITVTTGPRTRGHELQGAPAGIGNIEPPASVLMSDTNEETSMLEIRRDADIHAEEGGWFTARWHFSFGGYRDPDWMGIGPLRVFNDDRLVPGAVWPVHPHKDIEGITYVVEGLFEHEDSLGNGGYLHPGAVQRATLGSGMHHSERNGSPDEPMRFLQFWILPHSADLKPGLEQRQFTDADRTDTLLHVLSTDGLDGTVKVHGDADAYVSTLTDGSSVRHVVTDGRAAYVYLMDGQATFDDERVAAGDAAVASGPHELTVTGVDGAHLIVVDVVADYEPVGVWSAG